jgi:flagellar biosynthesis/type III secretory pathway chaperone
VADKKGDLFIEWCVFQLKRMKQIEQEKDVLMQGLQAVERAREWYLKQVAAVQEKMKYLGRMGSHMVSSISEEYIRNTSQNIVHCNSFRQGFFVNFARRSRQMPSSILP